MGAFVDPAATKVIDLPACYCPNTPHDHDRVTIRTQYGYGDMLELAKVHTLAGRIDPMAERARLLELGIREWTFLDDKGDPIPLGLPMILLLQPHIVEPIASAIDAAYEESSAPVPNPSSGPSPQPSPETPPASPNRATRRATRRSTSK